MSNVTATSKYSNQYLVEELFAFSYPIDATWPYSWCGGTDDIMPNVTITLTEPVVLYGLLSGGLASHYVTNFSMEYSESKNGTLLQHDPLGNLLVNTLVHINTCIAV